MDMTNSPDKDDLPGKLSRRHVIAGAAGLGVVAVAATAVTRAPSGPAATSTTSSFVARRPLMQAARADWEAQVGSIFRVEGGYRMRLAGVRASPGTGDRPRGVRPRGFVAVFDVLDNKTMAGDLIYGMWQREYGGMLMYLSGAENPARMLAVFN